MNTIKLSDVTMKQAADSFSLSFKEKIELAKLLDKLDVSVIELEPIVQPKIDALRIKSVASTVKHSIVAVPVQLSRESIDALKAALADVQIPVFISPGNHDFCDANSHYVRENWPKNVHIFHRGLESVCIPDLDCRVYGAGFTAMDCPSLLSGFRAQQDLTPIGILHGEVEAVVVHFGINRQFELGEHAVDNLYIYSVRVT